MISGDLKFEGFDARSWTNLISLFSPGVVDRLSREPDTTEERAVEPDADQQPTGNLVLVVDDHERLLKSFHSARGRVTGLSFDGDDDLPRLIEEYGARRAIVLREGVIDEISERLALRLQRGDDYVTQWLALLRIVREMQDAKLLRIHPSPLSRFPVPSPGTVRRALDLVLPDDHSLVVVLWDRELPWTSAAIRRRGGSIDLMVGPDMISRWTGPLGGDFRRDHRVVVDAVSRAVAPVHVGVFAQVDSVRELLRQGSPGAWATAVATREVIIHPTPPYMAVALGADAVRGVASVTARFLGGFNALQAISPLTQLVRSRVEELTSVSDTLGFNPLKAWSAVLRRDDERADSAGDE